jgi:hypothetical protein
LGTEVWGTPKRIGMLSLRLVLLFWGMMPSHVTTVTLFYKKVTPTLLFKHYQTKPNKTTNNRQLNTQQNNTNKRGKNNAI